MRHLIVVLFAGALFLPTQAPAQNKPDFSGTWKMDSSRSESAHQDSPIGPVSLIIRQEASEFSIETRRSESKSPKVSTETIVYKLETKEFTNFENSEVPIKSKAHWDGPKLVLETAREINGSTVTTIQVFQLDPGGKEITIDKTLTVQHGYQGGEAQKASSSGRDVFVKVRQ